VVADRQNGLTLSTEKAFETRTLNNQVYPADKAVYEHLSLAVRDASRVDDPDAPLFYVPLFRYPPGTPDDPSAAWYWRDETHRAITCPWPTDPEMRQRLIGLYFPEPTAGEE
jgi:hypothetical protein